MPSGFQKKRLVEYLLQGELVAYPTEAVFGLGCDPLNVDAVTRLHALKRRAKGKGFILIASDINQIIPYVKPLPDSVLSKIYDLNQEPTTWLLPARETVPKYLTGGKNTIAIRLVQHGLAKELCALAGMAIVSTSANLSGALPLRDAYKTRIKFQQRGVFTISGCVGGSLAPSQIIDPFSNKRYR
jgi:L-threonylcarbamoyladenylate synthase